MGSTTNRRSKITASKKLLTAHDEILLQKQLVSESTSLLWYEGTSRCHCVLLTLCNAYATLTLSVSLAIYMHRAKPSLYACCLITIVFDRYCDPSLESDDMDVSVELGNEICAGDSITGEEILVWSVQAVDEALVAKCLVCGDTEIIIGVLLP
jgi:hypothetical protein